MKQHKLPNVARKLHVCAKCNALSTAVRHVVVSADTETRRE